MKADFWQCNQYLVLDSLSPSKERRVLRQLQLNVRQRDKVAYSASITYERQNLPLETFQQFHFLLWISGGSIVVIFVVILGTVAICKMHKMHISTRISNCSFSVPFWRLIRMVHYRNIHVIHVQCNKCTIVHALVDAKLISCRPCLRSFSHVTIAMWLQTDHLPVINADLSVTALRGYQNATKEAGALSFYSSHGPIRQFNSDSTVLRQTQALTVPWASIASQNYHCCPRRY